MIAASGYCHDFEPYCLQSYSKSEINKPMKSREEHIFPVNTTHVMSSSRYGDNLHADSLDFPFVIGSQIH